MITSNYKRGDVPKTYQNQNEYVQLPFANLRLSWHNGNPAVAATEGVKHYGGWQSGSERFLEDLQALAIDAIPGIVENTWIDRDGEFYQAFGTRSIYAAPILARDDWWDEYDQKRSKNVKRHRVDFLVMLALYIKEKKILTPLCPAVLSASGYAASAILTAFKDFAKDTAEARKTFAPDIPEMLFYTPIGTFGNERIIKPAGDSSYVPCQFNKQSWDEKWLNFLFVGDEIAQYMIELSTQAAEWMADTHAANPQKQEVQAVPPRSDDGYPPQPPDQPFEDVPF